jgi:hypothetical protein
MMDSVYGEGAFEAMKAGEETLKRTPAAPSPCAMAWAAAAGIPAFAFVLMICVAALLIAWPIAPFWAYLKQLRKAESALATSGRQEASHDA